MITVAHSTRFLEVSMTTCLVSFVAARSLFAWPCLPLSTVEDERSANTMMEKLGSA